MSPATSASPASAMDARRSCGFASRLTACALLALAAPVFAPSVLGGSPVFAQNAQEDLAVKEEGVRAIVTPRGLTVWLKYEPSLPAVALEAQFRGGGMVDLPGETGASFLVGGLLEEGAGDLDAIAFQEARDDLGARILYTTQAESLDVTLWAPSENLEGAMDLLRLSLAKPRFDADAVARVRAQTVAIMRYQSVDPANLAESAFLKRLFPNDPYGRDYRGSASDYDHLTQSDLFEVLPRLTDRNRLMVAVVGDVDAARIAELVDKTFADLPADAAPDFAPTTPAVAPGEIRSFVDSPQSTIFFGHGGISNEDPDYDAARVLLHILGGNGANSRLTSELRDKRGLTYGVWAGLRIYDRAGLVSGQMAVSNERVGEAVEILRREWTRMLREGPTQEELDRSKRFLIGSFGLSLSSNTGLADFLIRSQRQDLGLDYIHERNEGIAAVTLEDVRRVAPRVLRPDELLISIAGGETAPAATLPTAAAPEVEPKAQP